MRRLPTSPVLDAVACSFGREEFREEVKKAMGMTADASRRELEGYGVRLSANADKVRLPRLVTLSTHLLEAQN